MCVRACRRSWWAGVKDDRKEGGIVQCSVGCCVETYDYDDRVLWSSVLAMDIVNYGALQPVRSASVSGTD